MKNNKQKQKMKNVNDRIKEALKEVEDSVKEIEKLLEECAKLLQTKITTEEDVQELVEQGVLKHIHTKVRLGYVSHHNGVFSYSGRFGYGYVVIRPSAEYRNCSDVSYYIYA